MLAITVAMNEGSRGHQLVNLTANARNEGPGGPWNFLYLYDCVFNILYGQQFFKVQYNLVVGSKIK